MKGKKKFGDYLIIRAQLVQQVTPRPFFFLLFIMTSKPFKPQNPFQLPYCLILGSGKRVAVGAADCDMAAYRLVLAMKHTKDISNVVSILNVQKEEELDMVSNMLDTNSTIMTPMLYCKDLKKFVLPGAPTLNALMQLADAIGVTYNEFNAHEERLQTIPKIRIPSSMQSPKHKLFIRKDDFSGKSNGEYSDEDSDEEYRIQQFKKKTPKRKKKKHSYSSSRNSVGGRSRRTYHSDDDVLTNITGASRMMLDSDEEEEAGAATEAEEEEFEERINLRKKNGRGRKGRGRDRWGTRKMDVDETLIGSTHSQPKRKVVGMLNRKKHDPKELPSGKHVETLPNQGEYVHPHKRADIARFNEDSDVDEEMLVGVSKRYKDPRRMKNIKFKQKNENSLISNKRDKDTKRILEEQRLRRMNTGKFIAQKTYEGNGEDFDDQPDVIRERDTFRNIDSSMLAKKELQEAEQYRIQKMKQGKAPPPKNFKQLDQKNRYAMNPSETKSAISNFRKERKNTKRTMLGLRSRDTGISGMFSDVGEDDEDDKDDEDSDDDPSGISEESFRSKPSIQHRIYGD